MSEPTPRVSQAELAVLRALWSAGPSRVRDLLAALEGRWAFTTVQTLLHRLEEKGCVERDREGGVTVYAARVSREELLRGHLDALARDLADGSVVSVVHGLVAGRQLTVTEIAEMRQLLDDLEPGGRKRRRARRR